MQTSDWAAEAYVWYESYHRDIANGTSEQVAERFEDLVVTDELYNRICNHPILKHIDYLNWQSSAFEILEQERGWKPLLRRLPTVTNNRLLTLIRRNLLLPIEGNTQNQTLVSRQQWALIEGIRWQMGLYKRHDVLDILHQQYTANKKLSTTNDKDWSKFLDVKLSENAGRYVVYNGTEIIQPGEVLFEATPFVVAPYDLDASKMTICFHCGRKSDRNPVRELTLQCSTCKVWSYCDASCRSDHSTIHNAECSMITPLLDKCTAIDIPLFKGILVYRAALKLSQSIEQEKSANASANNDDILQLECHDNDHVLKNPEYTEKVETLSSWMIENCFQNTTIKITREQIRSLFFAININAIGLGSGAVGLFSGMSSMFNHSCNENLTHSMDDDGVLRFRVVQSIHPGDECCISYVSNLQDPTYERTKSLEQYKFFTCQCSRCISSTEEGRIEAIGTWKNYMKELDDGKSNDTITIYRKLVDVSHILFPKYFVTKGWIMEECSHALMQDSRLQMESLKMLQDAREQYATCRGENSEVVKRVDESIRDLQGGSNQIQQTSNVDESVSSNHDELEGEHDDMKWLSGGWQRVVFEIKTYEPDTDLANMSQSIKDRFCDQSIVLWADSYRLCDVGYGIQSLILSCELNESLCTRTDLAEEVCEAFEDDIQHVDIVTASEYQ